MYNIIQLLKCSSPALAQHFEDSEKSIKQLNELSVDFETRLHTLEDEIGQRSLARIGTLGPQSTDNIYTVENYPFLDDESSKYALIIVDGVGANFIRFVTGTHTFLNVKIVRWENNNLTIGYQDNGHGYEKYAVVIVGDWTDEGLGRFYEEYCKLYNKIYAKIDTIYRTVTSWTDTVNTGYGADFINEILAGNAKMILTNEAKKYVINLLDGAIFNGNGYELFTPIGDTGYNIDITCNDITSTNPIFTIKYVKAK